MKKTLIALFFLAALTSCTKQHEFTIELESSAGSYTINHTNEDGKMLQHKGSGNYSYEWTWKRNKFKTIFIEAFLDSKPANPSGTNRLMLVRLKKGNKVINASETFTGEPIFLFEEM